MSVLAEVKFEQYQAASVVLKAITNPMRRDIITFLSERGIANITEIYTHFEIQQSLASQQIAILRRAGIVYCTRNGRQSCYQVSPVALSTLNDATKKLKELSLDDKKKVVINRFDDFEKQR